MNGAHTVVFSALTMFALSLACGQPAVGQDDDAGNLRVIQRAGTYDAFPGDLIQVVFQTQSTPNGIRTLKVEITGDSVSRVAVVASYGAPGQPYKISAFLKADKRGKSTIKVTPVQFDNAKRQTTTVKVDVTSPEG
jgi:hypothetical protein